MKRELRRKHSPVKAKSEEAVRFAAMLTPLEELERSERSGGDNHQVGGAIIVDTGKLMLPKGMDEEEKDASWWRGVNPAVLLIFVLALAFIGFIAYLISVEPPAR